MLCSGVSGLRSEQTQAAAHESKSFQCKEVLKPNLYVFRRAKVELYYNAELAFYGASMFMLLVWEERRHDFLVMMTHHLVTILLISFSYYSGCAVHCLCTVQTLPGSIASYWGCPSVQAFHRRCVSTAGLQHGSWETIPSHLLCVDTSISSVLV